MRADTALSRRLAGRTFNEIADELGYSSENTAQRAVRRAARRRRCEYPRWHTSRRRGHLVACQAIAVLAFGGPLWLAAMVAGAPDRSNLRRSIKAILNLANQRQSIRIDHDS
jgi:predicted transcriptional regulator